MDDTLYEQYRSVSGGGLPPTWVCLQATGNLRVWTLPGARMFTAPGCFPQVPLEAFPEFSSLTLIPRRPFPDIYSMW